MIEASRLDLGKLELFIAATMRRSTRLLRALESHGIAEADLVHAEAWAGVKGLLEPSLVTPDLIVECFGPPSSTELRSITYETSLWPDHLFRWSVTEWGLAAPSGFELRFSPGEPAGTGDLSDLVARLQVWHHTEAEVREALGEPVADRSWGNLGELYFGPTKDGQDVMLQFDYLLLTHVRRQPGLLADLQ